MRNLEVTDVYATDYSDGFPMQYLYLQTHQVVYTEYVQLSMCQLQLNRVVKGGKRQGGITHKNEKKLKKESQSYFFKRLIKIINSLMKWFGLKKGNITTGAIDT